jgi:hypothetical protein
MGFAPSRGVRQQKCSVTKKKGSLPWNLKKWQQQVSTPACEIGEGN